MVKKFLLVVAVLLIAGAFVVFRVWSNLDAIVASMIEESGSQALQTQVKVSGVEIALADAKAGLAGLTIANPPGYAETNIVELDSISVDLDLDSLGGEVIVLEAIDIGASTVSYELNSDGSSNMQTLLDSIEPAGQETTDSVKLIIEQLNFSGATVRVKSQIGPLKEQEIKLPGFTMQDIGKAEGGAAPEAIASEIGKRLAKDVMSAAARAGVEGLIDAQKEKLKDKIGGKLKNILDRD